MAFNFASASTQYLSATSAPVTAAPLSIACWFYPLNVTANMALVTLEDVNGLDCFNLKAMGGVTGDPVQFQFIDNSVNATARTTTGFTANAWNHACGTASSTTNRTAYLNAGGQFTDTTSSNPLVDRLKVGVQNFSGLTQYFSGIIAEVGIWNTALTAAEVASLAKGITCDKIRPQNLVFYAPLVRDLQDVRGGLTITNNNAATVATHPRVYA